MSTALHVHATLLLNVYSLFGFLFFLIVKNKFNILSAGNDGNAFTIEDNGQINVAAALDYGTQSSYSLTVQASDGTNTADATVTINLFSSNFSDIIALSPLVYIAFKLKS